MAPSSHSPRHGGSCSDADGDGDSDSSRIDWARVESQLPSGRDPASKRARDALWRAIDVNANGYLSLAEVDKGVRDVVALGGGGLDEGLYDAKPAIMRAFQAARRRRRRRPSHDSKRNNEGGDDYVERPEFRLLLLYLRDYFALWRAFSRVDARGDGDGRVSRAEFARARPMIESWLTTTNATASAGGGGDGEEEQQQQQRKGSGRRRSIADLDALFDEVDANGGGQILFGEFAEWAIAQRLDVEGVDDSDEDD